MKTKALAYGILQIIALVIINVLIYNIDKEIYKFSSIIIFGVIAGIIILLFSGYTIPSKWIFKYRFLFEGILFGFGISLFSRLTNLTDKGIFETADIIRELTVGIVVGAIVGILIFGSMRYWTYKRLKKKTPFIGQDDEMEILDDAARIQNEDIFETGRLMLTNNRLCFISSKNRKMIFEMILKDDNSDIQISYKSGMPNGIYIAHYKTKIYVRFPGLWLQEIEKV